MIKILTQICVEWGMRCFGVEHIRSRNMRATRFVEEAVELAQACGASQDHILRVVKMVYSRPPGGLHQEIGGCMVTLAVLCHTLGIDLEDAFQIEVLRCLSMDPAHFAKRNQEKLAILAQQPEDDQ